MALTWSQCGTIFEHISEKLSCDPWMSCDHGWSSNDNSNNSWQVEAEIQEKLQEGPVIVQTWLFNGSIHFISTDISVRL